MAWALLNIPNTDRGLMRMNSTRNRATPVATRYSPSTSPSGRGRRKERAPTRHRAWPADSIEINCASLSESPSSDRVSGTWLSSWW